MRDYLQGTIVVSDVRFFDEELKIAVDPDTVTFFYLVTGETDSDTITWDGETTAPAVDVIAKMGVGWYRTWIDSTNFIGVTGENWDGLGAHQAPGERQFNVYARGTRPI